MSKQDVEPPDERVVRPSVLVVYSVKNLGKIARHVGPLTRSADVTMVCVDGDESVDGVEYVTVPDVGYRPLTLLLMAFAALVTALRGRGRYDAVASFSLLPNGVVALLAGRLADAPTHLGIIGIDLDVHATARYGPLVRWLVRRFDAVTVPGEPFRDRLAELGVPRRRSFRLVNPIDADRFRPAPDEEVEYDLLWIGRFDPEKAPERFVDALAELDDRGVPFTAVMAGDGPLRAGVERRVRAAGLADRVDRPGWVDDPLSLYHRSGAFVLTSERDALPLTLVEAMATGLPSVVPPVGNVPDVARDEETALVVDPMTPTALADALEALLDDDSLREELGTNAATIGEEYSYDGAADDWRRVLDALVSPAPNDA
ncbi:glycosyltransferase [Halomarina oriensis]|uniref:Glycosyltransferase n=1 Tax=Halomarina oriensis TaxID=671145 RepID=A0A6B0GEQ7_9EURY|nr:glycosyltransferase [Halomarina oriensis]MWG33204.1 glycosyltransferase [Halomarina oriensis]